MALVSVNATEAGWDSAAPLAPALAALPAGAAVTVMIHGYRFAPGAGSHDPHGHVLSLSPTPACWKAVSWPRHLHLDRAGAGLGIGLGWPARGTVPQAARRAFGIGRTLAAMLREVGAARPDLRFNLFAHSLGARVALAALADLPRGAVHRVILLSAAEYRGHALAAMAGPAGRGAQVLNVTGRANAPFDLGFRLAVPAPRLSDWPLAAGLPGVPGWTDLCIDDPDTLAGLARIGLPTRGRLPPVCHWSSYLRPGLFRLYRGVLAAGPADPLPRLAALAAPPARAPARGPLPRLSPL
ncbi:hypothetical protein [Roseicyclus persicicus]|uniref:Alpha/beta hydrolase n=1 Tax=Roseicyclus persicicus TaxID=2650661 RepID=A0A7X6JZ09_9RHOB|nr:hypothetical protein [Roseibacterium persicicum]NKX44665.1 hypothetical protein [Roseibacterium persicicum]